MQRGLHHQHHQTGKRQCRPNQMADAVKTFAVIHNRSVGRPARYNHRPQQQKRFCLCWPYKALAEPPDVRMRISAITAE
jgi:hypothetical protein